MMGPEYVDAKYFLSDTARDLVLSDLEQIKLCWPCWVERLSIYFGGDDENNPAAITCSIERHSAQLTIHSSYFARPIDERQSILIHEASHAVTARAQEFWQHVRAFLRDRHPDASEIFDTLATDYFESATEDVAMAFRRAIGIKGNT